MVPSYYRRHCYLQALSIFSIAILPKPSTLIQRPRTPMEPQRFKTIKKSLEDMSIEELQEMSDDLEKLISVLMTRQVAIEDTILDKLEEAFVR